MNRIWIAVVLNRLSKLTTFFIKGNIFEKVTNQLYIIRYNVYLARHYLYTYIYFRNLHQNIWWLYSTVMLVKFVSAWNTVTFRFVGRNFRLFDFELPSLTSVIESKRVLRSLRFTQLTCPNQILSGLKSVLCTSEDS